MPTSYRVYVIELARRVYTEDRKFRDANPQFNGVQQCVYVGMTSKTAYERFDEHINGTLSKKGYDLSAAIVKKYGVYLRPSLYEQLPAYRTKAAALAAEKALALELRRQRYAVWFN